MTATRGDARPLVPIFEADRWAMRFSDRLVLEGLLSQVKPELAIEVGVAQGASLTRIAAHSDEVHGIDVTRDPRLQCPPNATFHLGSSTEVLPGLLADFSDNGRNVDFVHVDGDHGPEAVRADLELLLDSPAISRTVILMHDSFNPWVRSGIEAAAPELHPKVAFCALHLLPGSAVEGGPFDGQLWGGFAVVIVDESGATRDLGRIKLGRDQQETMPSTVDAWRSAIRARDALFAYGLGGSRSGPVAKLRRLAARARARPRG